jgi:hypothetical protein
MVLLNPWVRSEATLAKVHLTQYYPQRLASRDFWVRLIAGKVDVIRALRALANRFSALNRAHIDGTSRVQSGFQSKMLDALKDFGGPILLITSDRDLTAMEFLEHWRSSGTFDELVARGNVEHHALAAADHTFSSAAWRGDVEQATLNWLQRRFSLQPR